MQSIQNVQEIIEGISNASSEQSGGISHVHVAISEMDHVTQQNTALAEEATAAAESLKEQAGKYFPT